MTNEKTSKIKKEDMSETVQSIMNEVEDAIKKISDIQHREGTPHMGFMFIATIEDPEDESHSFSHIQSSFSAKGNDALAVALSQWGIQDINSMRCLSTAWDKFTDTISDNPGMLAKKFINGLFDKVMREMDDEDPRDSGVSDKTEPKNEDEKHGDDQPEESSKNEEPRKNVRNPKS